MCARAPLTNCFYLKKVSGLIGSLSVLLGKCAGEMLRATVLGDNQFRHPLSYMFFLGTLRLPLCWIFFIGHSRHAGVHRVADILSQRCH